MNTWFNITHLDRIVDAWLKWECLCGHSVCGYCGKGE